MGGPKGSRIAAASHDPGIRRHPVPPAPIHLSQDTSQKLSIHSRIETQGKAARNLTCSFLRTASNWVHINGRMRLFVKMMTIALGCQECTRIQTNVFVSNSVRSIFHCWKFVSVAAFVTAIVDCSTDTLCNGNIGPVSLLEIR